MRVGSRPWSSVTGIRRRRQRDQHVGRMYISLKPLAERKVSVGSGDRAPAPKARRRSRRHALSCRPSRTSASAAARPTRSISSRCESENLERPEHLGAAHAGKAQERCRSCATFNSDQQDKGLQARAGDRSRHRLAPGHSTQQTIDNTLYDAFGQRQVSTIYTQLNQYHVVMEVDSAIPAESGRAQEYLRAVVQRHASAAERLRPLRGDDRDSLAVNHQGQFPAVTLSFNLDPALRSATPSMPRRSGRARNRTCPPSIHASSRARRRLSGLACRTSRS